MAEITSKTYLNHSQTVTVPEENTRIGAKLRSRKKKHDNRVTIIVTAPFSPNFKGIGSLEAETLGSATRSWRWCMRRQHEIRTITKKIETR
ncbi:hypothetical protein QL285_061235 [Trifolium repens]|nr:hypothetical protein QL285_061235 [Trifolium repens]